MQESEELKREVKASDAQGSSKSKKAAANKKKPATVVLEDPRSAISEEDL